MIRSFNFTLKKKQVFSTSISETSENVCVYFLIVFPWSLYSHTVFTYNIQKLTLNTKYLLELIKKDQKFEKEYITWTCFKFWPMKKFSENYEPMRVLMMACLQIYRQSFATFLLVHLNSKEVSYLSWQNTYPELKTTCHIKLKFFLCTKLLQNLLIAKYLISVAATLSLSGCRLLFKNCVTFLVSSFLTHIRKMCTSMGYMPPICRTLLDMIDFHISKIFRKRKSTFGDILVGYT